MPIEVEYKLENLDAILKEKKGLGKKGKDWL